MAETLAARLRRLLVLIPFVTGREAVSVEELCERFQISRPQLIADLNLLFVCGLPSYGPGDLIEADIVGNEVTIRTAGYFSRPLRLTAAEGLLLYCGARAMEAAGVLNEALHRAVKRLEEALGPEALRRVDVALEGSFELGVVRQAIAASKRIHIRYHSPYKDETTERDVDPWGVFASGGHWYLVGWCHHARGERVFRVDRMQKIRALDAPAEIPPELDLSSYEALYIPKEGDTAVTVDLAPRVAAWVAEYYPLESQESLPDGWIRVRLHAGGTAWLERLLVRLGPRARVIEPPGLRDRVRNLACAILERYKP